MAAGSLTSYRKIESYRLGANIGTAGSPLPLERAGIPDSIRSFDFPISIQIPDFAAEFPGGQIAIILENSHKNQGSLFIRVGA